MGYWIRCEDIQRNGTDVEEVAFQRQIKLKYHSIVALHPGGFAPQQAQHN
jgi:hypothetical protein